MIIKKPKKFWSQLSLVPVLSKVITIVQPLTTPTYVQGNIRSFGSGASTSLAVTLPNNVGSGNLVIVSFGGAGDGIEVTVTDDKSNSYSLVSKTTAGGYTWASFYALNITNSPKIVTASYGSSSYITMVVDEFSGIATSNALDGYAINGNQTGVNTTNGITSTAITTTADGDLIYGSVVNLVGSSTLTKTSTFTQAQVSGQDFNTEYRIQSTKGSVAATWTGTTQDQFSSFILAFKAATPNTNGVGSASGISTVLAVSELDEDSSYLSEWPDETNTGVPSSFVASLANSTGIISSSADNQVIELHNVTGGIYVSHNNVTVRHNKIKMNDNYGIQVVDGLTTPPTIYSNEIDGQSGYTGIFGYGTIKRNHIHTLENGIVLLNGNDGSYVRDNYVHDMTSGPDAHYDCLEINGNINNTTIEHNKFLNTAGQTSAINLNNYDGAANNILITNNWCEGGGYPIYCAKIDGHSEDLTNVTISYNLVANGSYSYFALTGTSPSLIGNYNPYTGVYPQDDVQTDYLPGNTVFTPSASFTSSDSNQGISFRTVVTLSDSIVGSFRVAFKGSQTKQMFASHVSVGKQSSAAATTATPVEVTFGGGSSGFTLKESEYILSDPVTLTGITLNSGDKLVVIWDLTNVNQGQTVSSGNSNVTTYFLTGETWDQSSPSGLTESANNNFGLMGIVSNDSFASPDNFVAVPLSDFDMDYPNPSNTGPRISLTPHSGQFVTTANNQVIQGLDISGSVRIRHNNVQLVDCKISSTDSIVVEADANSPTGIIIEYCEINGMGSASYGINMDGGGGGAIIRYNNIYGTSTAAIGIGEDNEFIEYNFVHDLISGDAVTDVKAFTALYIRNNAIYSSVNSCINMQNTSNGFTNLLTLNNLLVMTGSGITTVIIRGDKGGGTVSGCVFAGNKLGTGSSGYTDIVGTTVEWGNNTDYLTGSAVTLS